MLDRLNASLAFYKQALDLRGQRQEVLAANIANSDTPNYKARDFDFKSELDRAMGSNAPAGPNALTLRTTAAGHIAGQAQGLSAGAAKLEYRNATQPSLDGNTVDMNVERVEFMENAVHYQANLQILGSQLKSLKSAMQPER
ncbi:flagellar basal body rod protein FlgB [Salinisphaera aquimarina]|uniref:Flagellar basal body rod protein FlgB n=1 Tax=Salinisphaera aquimarina TaxID=2094031 RepID=A0ABV7EN76_9GAMM